MISTVGDARQTMAMQTRSRGFTIVELLIVIIVIGILATLVLVAYANVTDQAKTATIKSDIEGAVKTLASDRESGGGASYPATAALANGGKGLQASSGNTIVYDTSGSTYCVTVNNGKTSYYATNTTQTPQVGGCNIKAGLVGWWPLNGTPNAQAGYGNNGTISGTVTSVPGQSGQANGAYSFPGDSSAMIDTNTTFSLETYSFSLWTYQTLNGTYQTPLSETRDCCGTGYHGFELSTSYTANNLIHRLWKSDGTQTGASGGTTDLNSWDFFVGTYDGSTINLYKNGSLVTSSAYSGGVGTPTTTLKIGRMGIQPAGAFGGSIDDVHVYNRALSQAEVTSLYAAGAQ